MVRHFRNESPFLQPCFQACRSCKASAPAASGAQFCILQTPLRFGVKYSCSLMLCDGGTAGEGPYCHLLSSWSQSAASCAMDGMTHCTGSHRSPPNAATYCYDALDRA